MNNRMYLQDLVQGRYGRKIAYTSVDKITTDNVVKVIGECIGTFYYNKSVIRYLWNYYKGDQPILYRQKLTNEDITNRIVENHAYEIVQFKVGQTYGEPIQFISRKDDEAINKAVDMLNDFMADANKQEKDIKAGEWQSATGTSFKAARPKANSDVPFLIVAPTPMNTFSIYNDSTEEPMLSVQELKDENGNWYKLAFSDTTSYKIQDGKLIESKLHTYGGIPIVEFPNNHERISDIELVIGMLDAINNMQSNRMDGVEQFDIHMFPEHLPVSHQRRGVNIQRSFRRCLGTACQLLQFFFRFRPGLIRMPVLQGTLRLHTEKTSKFLFPEKNLLRLVFPSSLPPVKSHNCFLLLN